MTTERKAKRRKLRNAEYYDFQAVQDMLYQNSLDNKVFINLMQYIVSDENIRLAFRNMKKNAGSKTAGVDKKTIKDLEKWQDERLIKFVRKKFEWYTPQAVRRVEIPKSNGKMRPLGIPTITDRLIQQCIIQVLEPVCEAKFHERNNGFRPNRSTEHAIAQCYKFMQIDKLQYVVDIDIKGFFDNINHGKLLKQIWTLGIRDKKLISIISAMLKAEVAGIGFPEFGAPQGSLASPLLSNIVLNELDWWIASQWENIKTHNDKAYFRKDNGVMDKGKLYTKLRKTNLKECYGVRYADDFKIFCRTRQDAVKMFVATKQWLKDRLGLDISEEKSKIINLKREYSEFLGFKLKLHPKGKDKNEQQKYAVISHISDKAKIKIKEISKKYIGEIQNPANSAMGYEVVNRYNAFVMGTHNYYCKATHVSNDFSTIAFSVKKSLKARFKSELKPNGKHLADCIRKIYGSSSQLRYIHNTALAPIGFVQHKNPMFKKKTVNQYTVSGRSEIHKNLECVNTDILKYLMRNPVKNRSIEYNDNRLSLYSAQHGKCSVTGQILEIGNMHTHHKIPTSIGGKDGYMNLTIVTTMVHRLIHSVNKELISQYLKILKISEKQLKKVNKLRILANREEI
ncbi:MAG: group II intron reverse transcriptase/maturase [Oscillospiraceae bacterium]|nr:group II intron reverse transcriptase/maturase [Oscillospiraceae bacterium]